MKQMVWFIQTFLLLWLILTISLLLFGCGSDLTGGSIPPGNPGQQNQTRLVVTVVDENDPSVPLADAEIEITLDDGRKILGKTDVSGRFVVDLPSNRQCTIKVRPPKEFFALYQELVDNFITDAGEIWLLIPVSRKDTIAHDLFELQILPKEAELKVRESIQFQVQLRPLPQRPIRPVWSVHGGIGIVTPDGLFIATRPGQGIVRVRIGNLSAEAIVTVLPE
ncbi:MAG: hypothetical protein NZ805_04715 [Armatimonadetes bacterium]|nr:hypothetical protein [Armatimonadota bacterium]